jgi:hypothetical protein
MACATIASVLNITKAVENGIVVEPAHDCSPGAIVYAIIGFLAHYGIILTMTLGTQKCLNALSGLVQRKRRVL